MKHRTLWNITGLISISVLVVAVAGSIAHIMDTQGEGLPLYALLSCVMDIGGMIVCIILFLTTLYDHRVSTSTVYFMAMVIIEGFILFLDYGFWNVDGNPDLILINKMISYYHLGFILILVAAFWMYIREFAHNIDERFFRIQAAVFTILVLNMIIVLTNPFNNLVFSVDSAGVYSRGVAYFLTFLGPALALILCTYVIAIYVDGRRKKLTLCSYLVFPTIGSVIQIMFYGSGLIDLGLLFSIVLLYSNLYIERGQDILEKQAEITSHTIAMMAAQIQPRFLYQSLDSIADLDGTPEETKEAIKDFAKYFQVNMHSFSETGPISFEKELEHVRTYVHLEKLRFKEKLDIEFDLQDTDFEIPALTLQMLVENAIKHGITTKENGGSVRVTTMESATEHKILVVDDGVGFDPSAPRHEDGRSHVGLANVSQRLKDMVDGTLTLDSSIGKGTTAIVTIPKKP